MRRWLLVAITLLLVPLFLLAPITAIAWRAAPSLGATLRDPAVAQALWISLTTSLLTTGLALLLGTPLAWLLARRDFPGRTLLAIVVELPLVLPPAVAGIGLLMAFGRRGLIGRALAPLGIELPFTSAAVVMAQFFVAAPFYIRAATSAFRAIDPRWSQVAATLGVPDWRTFWRVTLPLAAPGLLAGLILCWARALGEFGATILFAGNLPGRTQTMPLAIFATLERDLDVALAIGLLLVLLTFVLLALLRRIAGGDAL